MNSDDDDDDSTADTSSRPLPFSPVVVPSSQRDDDHNDVDDDDDAAAADEKRPASPLTASASPPPTTPAVAKTTSTRAPDESILKVLEVCAASVLNTNETFQTGWHVMFVNQWGKEQERILLLSNKNLYRVKFDFAKCQVIHYDRTDLVKIDMIHKGWLRVEGGWRNAELAYKTSKNGQRLFGVRVLAGDNKNPKITDKEQYMRTYAALTATADGGKSLANEIANAVAAQAQARCSKSTLVTEVDIVVSNGAPLISSLHNSFGLGLFKKKQQ